MAVIQDLPAELLYRILELMENAQRTTDQQAETRRSFARTSLVARSWRAPSQCLLASTLRVYNDDSFWERYLAAIADPSASPFRTLQYLAVGGSDSEVSANDLGVLQCRGIAVQELEIYGRQLELTSAHMQLLQAVRRLTLVGSIRMETDMGSSRLTLEALCVYSYPVELPGFMLPLSTFAPRLTRLTLTTWSSHLSDSLNAPLQDLAPQLMHLHLELEPSSPLQGDGFDMDRFLSACTSLTSLQVDHVNPLDLKYILSSFPSPLILLNVYLILRSAEGARQLMTVQLAGVFDLASMAKLKRWRLSHAVYDGPMWIPMSELALEEWRAACRERGIEPRGQERYFTD